MSEHSLMYRHRVDVGRHLARVDLALPADHVGAIVDRVEARLDG